MARDFSLLGDQVRALESADRALAIANELKDVGLQHLTTAYFGSAHHALGNYHVAIEALKSSVASLEDDRPIERFGLPGPAAVFFRSWLAWSLTKVGEFAEGADHGQEGLRIAESLSQPLVIAVASYSLGFVWLHKGILPPALQLLERSLELCRTWNLLAWFTNIASSLGYAYALSGRPEEGIGLLKSAVEQTSSMKILVNHAAELVWLAEACLIGGLVNEAGSYGRQAYDLAKEHRERGNEASALRLLGDVASCRDSSQVDSITDQYGQALALATELRMLPLVAHCHLSLGTLLRRAGHEKRAKEHLTTATTMYQEMGMAFWLEKAEAAFRLP